MKLLSERMTELAREAADRQDWRDKFGEPTQPPEPIIVGALIQALDEFQIDNEKRINALMALIGPRLGDSETGGSDEAERR